MALIGKIRNNFWFVLLVLGLALAAFVIMDMVNAGNQGGIGPKQIIGEVAGQDIDYTEFQKAEQALYAGGNNPYAGKTSTWNYLTEKAIVSNQAEKLGIGISNDELTELQFGSNLSPVIQSIYRNPQTGQINMQSLLEIKQALQNGDDLNPDFKLRWQEIQKQIIKTGKQDKINALVSKSIFTPTFLAENAGKATTKQATFEYVKIPFDNMADSEIEVTDADISNYIKENAFKYTNEEETRVFDYAVLNVYPTSADSANIKSSLAETASTFGQKRTTTEDSIYTVNNEGFYNPFYAKKEDLSEALQTAVSDMEVDDVYGPYLDQGAYFLAKLTGKAVIPDSVQASHILRGGATPADIVNARQFIDSLKNLVETRQATFEELATLHSQDPGSKDKEGDLGMIAQGRMLPALNDAMFIDSKEGGLYTVTTSNGVHLVNVKKRVFDNRDPKYKIALLRSVIVPSEETQNAVYEEADQIVSANRSLDALREAIEGKANISMETSSPLKTNDYLFGNLGGSETSREIIRWGFDEDTEIGNVSPSIHTYTDEVNYYNNKYVLVSLAGITAPGLAKASDLRNDLEVLVRNEKKGKAIASSISGSDLAGLASSNNATVETASNVAFTAGGITGLGNEPKVLSAAFGQAEGTVSSPIVGNTGVYIVKTVSKTEGTVPANVIAQKTSLNNTNRGRVGFSLLNALKETFKPTDNRSKYF